MDKIKNTFFKNVKILLALLALTVFTFGVLFRGEEKGSRELSSSSHLVEYKVITNKNLKMKDSIEGDDHIFEIPGVDSGNSGVVTLDPELNEEQDEWKQVSYSQNGATYVGYVNEKHIEKVHADYYWDGVAEEFKEFDYSLSCTENKNLENIEIYRAKKLISLHQDQGELRVSSRNNIFKKVQEGYKAVFSPYKVYSRGFSISEGEVVKFKKKDVSKDFADSYYFGELSPSEFWENQPYQMLVGKTNDPLAYSCNINRASGNYIQLFSEKHGVSQSIFIKFEDVQNSKIKKDDFLYVCPDRLWGYKTDPADTFKKGDGKRRLFKNGEYVKLLNTKSPIVRNPGWKDLKFVWVQDPKTKIEYWMAEENLKKGEECAPNQSFDDVINDLINEQEKEAKKNEYGNKEAYVCLDKQVGLKKRKKVFSKKDVGKMFKKNDSIIIQDKESFYADPGWGGGTKLQYVQVKDIATGKKYWMAVSYLSIGLKCGEDITKEDKEDEPDISVEDKEYEEKYKGVKSYFNDSVKIVKGVPVLKSFQGNYVCANEFISGFKSKKDVEKYSRQRKLEKGTVVYILEGKGNKSFFHKKEKIVRVKYKGKKYWVKKQYVKPYSQCSKFKAQEKQICATNVNYRNESLRTVKGRYNNKDKIYLRNDQKYQRQEKVEKGVLHNFIPVSKGESSKNIFWVSDAFVKTSCGEDVGKESVLVKKCKGVRYKMHTGDRFPLGIVPKINFLTDGTARQGAGRVGCWRDKKGRKNCGTVRRHAGVDLYTVKRKDKRDQKKHCSVWSKSKKCRERRVYAINDGIVVATNKYVRNTSYTLIKSPKSGYSLLYAEMTLTKKAKRVGGKIKKGDYLGVATKIRGFGSKYPPMLHLEKYEKTLSLKQYRSKSRRGLFYRHSSLSRGLPCYVDELHKKKFNGKSIKSMSGSHFR